MGGIILGQAALIGNDLGPWFGEQPGASPGEVRVMVLSSRRFAASFGGLSVVLTVAVHRYAAE